MNRIWPEAQTLRLGDGEKRRWRRLKKKEPTEKARIDVPDFFHRLVPAVAPNPR